MADNVEVLRGGYEAFGRGDMDAVMQTWADDIEWEGPNATELPGGGTHRGKQDVAQMAGQIAENWDPFHVQPDEFLEQGDTVVVLGHIEGTAKSTGKDAKVPFVHVWRMSDGKVKRVQALIDTAVVLDALRG
jgi:uncharacterized protein